MSTDSPRDRISFDVWNMIDGAEEYLINRRGLIRHQSGERNYVRIRRTKIRGRRYANLIVNGKVKRVYVDRLIKKYFHEEAKK